MLWQVNFNRLQQAITPSAEKLAKHGVESVRQRVVNLCTVHQDKHLRITPPISDMAELMTNLTDLLATKIENLPRDAHEAIDQIEHTYLDPAFLHPET